MKYRKKPIVIEASQFFPDKKPWPFGVEQYNAKSTESLDGYANVWYGWRVKTLEGVMEVKPGDWVITGVNGEIYPCKPSIFEKTYERVEESGEKKP